MSPYDRAKAFYAEHKLDFEKEIEAYVQNGYVHFTPDYVLISRRCGDGWYIRMALGNGHMAAWWRLMPYFLPYIGWSRIAKGRHECRWHETRRLMQITQRYEHHVPILTHSGEPDRFHVPIIRTY